MKEGQGNKNFKGCTIKDIGGWVAVYVDGCLQLVNFEGADLTGANLSRTKLSGVRFSNADLRGADLRGSDLRGAQLGSAKLNGANLSGAKLRGAYLYGADLTGADLTGADLEEINFTKVKLDDVDLAMVRNPPVSISDRVFVDFLRYVTERMNDPLRFTTEDWQEEDYIYNLLLLEIRDFPKRVKKLSITKKEMKLRLKDLSDQIKAKKAAKFIGSV
jgi:hypothetical protein